MTHEILIRRNPVFAAIEAGRRELFMLWVQEDVSEKTVKPVLELARERGVKMTRASKQKLSNLAQDGRHQGLVLETGPYVYATLDDMLAEADRRQEMPFLLVLDLLHGPQNIGSLLRTAEICGLHGVIVQDRRAPDITPSVVQYSAGAAEYLLVYQAVNLARTLSMLQQRDIWVAGLDMDDHALPYGTVDLDRSIALVVGHEGSGLRRVTKKHCDFLVRLPMRGHTESLNAAVAGSVLMYAAWQARVNKAEA